MSTEANKTLVRRLVEEFWNKGNADVFDEVFAAGFVDRTPQPGSAGTKEGFRQLALALRAAFSDGQTTVDDLIALGHRRIAHIAGPSIRFTGRDRRRGYEDALAEAGIPLDPALVVEGDYSFASGEALMRQRLAERPTAVFVSGDAMALGAIRALAKLGVRVPEDLSLAAFGYPDFVRYATPAITTADLPVAAAGRAAVELIVRRIRDPEVREVIRLETALLVRDTTAPIRPC